MPPFQVSQCTDSSAPFFSHTCSWSTEQGMFCLPIPVRAPENSVSRDSLSRPIPRKSAYSPNIGPNLVLNHGIFPAFREGVNLYCQPPSGQSRVCHLTKLHTDGVHCREYAGTGPKVFEVVPVTGAAFSGIDMEQIICASLFPDSQMVCSGHV